MGDTIDAMQAGSFSCKFIALLEGCEFVLSDCDDESAVQTALAGTDWENATVIPWLRVELKNEQSISPLDSFIPNQSRCLLRVGDHDRADTFGKFVHKRLSGAETTLAATIDRNDTTITVKSTASFPSFGTLFIGTEAIVYGGVTATTFTSCVRGVYSPFGCDASGIGGDRFANHHRWLSGDSSHPSIDPVVSQLPRTWLSKRVGVWLHTWDAGASTLNTRAEAQLVFAGRLVGIADDANTFETVLDVEPFLEEVRNGVIGKDIWGATVAPGLNLREGRTFQFQEWLNDGTVNTANDLTVVASGASGTNQMDAGSYSLSELSGKISAWLAGEARAARLDGTYTMASPVSSNVGLRTKMYWRYDNASDQLAGFTLQIPGEVSAFMGLNDEDPGKLGQTSGFRQAPGDRTNEANIAQGNFVPFETLIFKPYGPGRIGQEFADLSLSYDAENERGTFVDQRELLPASIKNNCPAGSEYGMFLLDDRCLMVGSFDTGTLQNCWLAPFQLTADKDHGALGYIGRRADEPEAGPITLRQVFVFEGEFRTLFLTMLYGSGTSGYNHSLDTLGYGLGLGLPGGLLRDEMDRSVANLPGSNAPLVVVIDEPTKFEEIFSSDLKIRRAFIRWINEGISMKQWSTPVIANAVTTLDESNKAEPSGQQANHRAPSQEASLTQRPVVKIDYCKDFATGRDGQFLKSVQLEDAVAVDDLGGNIKPETIKMRNTFSQFTNTGVGVEALLPEFMSFMPCVSRPQRMIARSIDLRFFETISVGDIITLTDSFARDPITGARGIGARAAVVTRLWYDLGGNDAGGSIRQMAGGVELMFMDSHRGELYCPSANIDETANAGGFSAGYNNGTSTIRCHAQVYSHSITITTKRGGTIVLSDEGDATNFTAGDKILIVERDPATPGSPLSWERTILSQTNDDIELTTTLSAPAWDATKQYLVTFQKYSQVTATQQDYAYQADDADHEVEGDPPFHYARSEEPLAYTTYTPRSFENTATLLAGDGRAQDCGTDANLASNANILIDYKTAHQGAFLSSEFSSAGLTGQSNDTWLTLFAFPMFFGTEHLTSTVGRVLTVAPFFRSGTGGVSAWVRVTICRAKPMLSPSTDEGDPSGGPYGDPIFPSEFSRTTEWTTTSATWGEGAETTLDLSVKDLSFGYCWILVEGAGAADCRGLAKCIEGPRTVNT